MSQSNDLGEESERTDPIGDEFQFFFPFAKTLALDLSTPEDKSIAAAWVQKLEAEPESEEEKRTRLNYLKLLLFVLQRGRLSGIFRKQPPSGALQPFPQGLSILDMGNMMLDQDDAPYCGEGDARCLPYSIEISNDLREFVASQEIPNFGVQMYYAWSSDEPIHKWLCFDEDKFPQFVLDKIKQLKEIQSDEKATIIKNGCITLRKGCDIPLLEKISRKKVKSPQEIERSQGRSFHTYMGLVGRMGNFDNCDDDQDKYQRQEPRKRRYKERTEHGPLSGSGGEAEDMVGEEECEDSPQGLGGLNAINRPCFCPESVQRPKNASAQLIAKGGFQPCDDKQTSSKSYNISVGAEAAHWNSGANRPPQRRYNEEQCPDDEAAPPMQRQMQVQKRNPSPRPKSSAGNRADIECPPQENVDECVNECVCPSPPCSCPCPRTLTQAPMRRTPSSTNTPSGGMPPKNSSRSYAKQDDRAYHKSLVQEQENCPTTGRPNEENNKLPLILHCYSEDSPDPTLLQVIGKMNPAHWPNVNNAYQPQYQKGNVLSNRECFDPMQQQGRVCQGQTQRPDCQLVTDGRRQRTPLSMGQRHRSPVPQKSARTPSPETCSRPCEPVQESPPSRPNRQVVFNPQQVANDYLECDCPPPNRPNQMRPEICRKPASAPCKGSQPMFRPKAYYSNNFLAAPPPNADRMASMANVLQGIKQKTEAHREKCDSSGTRKSAPGYCQLPTNICADEAPPQEGPAVTNYCTDMRPQRTPMCTEGGGYQRQGMMSKTGKCSNHMSEGVYANVNAFQGKNTSCGPQMPQRQSPCQQVQTCTPLYSNRRQDVCEEVVNEEDSSESAEECAKEPEPNCEMPPPSQKPLRMVPKIYIEDTQGNVQPFSTPGTTPGKFIGPYGTEWASGPSPIAPTRVLQCEQRPKMQPDMQNCAPQRVTLSKPPKQDPCNYREPNMPVGAPGRTSSPKVGRENYEEMPNGVQMYAQAKQSKFCPKEIITENCSPQHVSLGKRPNDVRSKLKSSVSQREAPSTIEEEPSDFTEVSSGKNSGHRRLQTHVSLAEGYSSQPAYSTNAPESQSRPTGRPGKVIQEGAGYWDDSPPGGRGKVIQEGAGYWDDSPPGGRGKFLNITPSTNSCEKSSWSDRDDQPRSLSEQQQIPVERDERNGSIQRNSPGLQSKQGVIRSPMLPPQNLASARPRRTQISFKDQYYPQPECYDQMPPQTYQQPQECPQLTCYQSCRGNVYVEKSLECCNEQQGPRVKTSSPKEWMGSVSRDNFPNCSSIRSNDVNECDQQVQMDFCEEEEPVEFFSLNSNNADCSAEKYINKNDCPQFVANNPQCVPINVLQGRGNFSQSLNEDYNVDECDNAGNNNYY